MHGNGKVFISHAHDDNARCAPVLAALDAWGVDYWFDTRRLEAGDDLSQTIQRAIASRDIFLRICTPAAQRSYWVKLETGAFRGLQARQHRAGGTAERVLINLILDSGYEPEPFDYAHLFIDASARPRQEWLEELRRALGVTAPGTVATGARSIVAAGPTAKATISGARDYVVDQSGDGEFPTISAALLVAGDGDEIRIRPGRYQESLVIEKAVALIGDGERGRIVVEGTAASALRIVAGPCRVENLTIRQSGAPHVDAVVIAGGRVELARCDITTQTHGACVNITSADEVKLRVNVIHDGHGWGVFAAGKGIVTLESNEIDAHANSGLTVMRDAYVVARGNRINRNAQYAIRIDAGAGGQFEDNDLTGNLRDAWDIDRSSFGKVMRTKNKG